MTYCAIYYVCWVLQSENSLNGALGLCYTHGRCEIHHGCGHGLRGYHLVKGVSYLWGLVYALSRQRGLSFISQGVEILMFMLSTVHDRLIE